jgi:hypothetical protein
MKQTNLSKYRAITGHLPSRYDVSQWNEAQYLQFFELCSAFMEGETLRFRAETILAQEQKALSGPFPFLQELFYRINVFSTDPLGGPLKFKNKFMALVRQVGQYIRLNPSVVTEKMRPLLEGNPRLAWSLKHYEMADTKMGVPVVVPDTRPQLGARPIMNPQDPQVRILEAQTFLADALVTMTRGLSKTELKELGTKDKLQLSIKIIDMMQKNKNWKPNIGTLNNIQINASSREDLESALLDFGQKRNEENE